VSQTHAIEGVGVGGDEGDGEVGLGGIGRQQGGDLGDGDAVATEQVFRCVSGRRRRRGAQGVDEPVADVAGEGDGGVGGWGGFEGYGIARRLVMMALHVRASE
jgi:hypothetical protein